MTPSRPAWKRASVDPMTGHKLLKSVPISGTIIDDPSTNPEFILKMLIRFVFNCTDELTQEQGNLVLAAMAEANFWHVNADGPSSMEGRTDSVLGVIDDMIILFNTLTAADHTAPFCTVPDAGLHPKNRTLSFVGKNWKWAREWARDREDKNG